MPRRSAMKPRAPRRRVKSVATALTKNQKKAVKKLVAAPMETKYHAQSPDERLNQAQLTNELISHLADGTMSNLQTCFPKLVQGTEASQRIGNRINLTSGKTRFYFYLDTSLTGTADIVVKLFLLNSKSAKSFDAATTLGVGQLLDDGDGVNVDWNPIATDTHFLNMYRLNNEQFTGTTKTFRLSKNMGYQNGAPVAGEPATPNLPQGAHASFTWNWGGKKVIKYGENGGQSSLPNNFYPMWGAVAYYADNTTVGVQGAVMPVYVYSRSEIFYKDA